MHPLDERGDLGRGDTGEVVSDRHVEHMWPRVLAHVLAKRLPLAKNVEEHRRLDVLGEALRDPQLLAPLDVVPDRLHVDARAFDLEVVEDLHRLQLEQAGSAEPCEDDVLGELTVRSGSGADRGRTPAAEEVEAEIDVGVGFPVAGGRQVEDPVSRLPLVGDPGQELLEPHRCEWSGHPVGRVPRMVRAQRILGHAATVARLHRGFFTECKAPCFPYRMSTPCFTEMKSPHHDHSALYKI